MKRLFFFFITSIIVLQGIFIGCTEEIEDSIKVESFTFDKDVYCIKVGESIDLEYTCIPSEAASNIRWQISEEQTFSSSEAVVSIEGNTITGLSRGCVEISAYVDNWIYGPVGVFVDMLLEEGDVIFEPDPLVLDVGEKKQFSAYRNKYKPYWNGEPDINNDDDSFILNFLGVNEHSDIYEVYAQSPGSGYFALEFTAPFTNVPFRDTLFITVNPVELEGIAFSSKEYDVEEMDVIHNPIVFTPENATNKNVSFYIENPDIVEFDESGNIFAKNVGSTRIKAVSEDGGYTADCEAIVGYKGIYISNSPSERFYGYECVAGETVILYSYNEVNDEPYLGAFWYSDNSSVAKVTADGEMTNSALLQTYQPGYCEIHARMKEDLSKIAEFWVRVHDIIDYLKLTGSSEVHEWNNNKMSLTYSGEIENSSSQDVKLISVAAMSDDLSTLYYLEHYNTYLLAKSSYALEPFYIENYIVFSIVVNFVWIGELVQLV